MKKLGMLMVVLTLCLGWAMGAYADEAQSYTSGDYEYTVQNGKATMTKYSGNQQNVQVPETLGNAPVAEIGEDAFRFNDEVVSITLPSTVEIINERAFWGCKQLKLVSLPASVTTISNNPFAFSGQMLLQLDEANPVFELIDGVLYHKAMKQLCVYPLGLANASFTVPEGTVSIGYAAFVSAEKLETLIIPNSVTEIGKQAVRSSGLTNVSLPSGLKTIGEYAFHDCQDLISAYVPATVGFSGADAFSNCPKLTVYTDAQGYVTDYMRENGIPCQIATQTQPMVQETPAPSQPEPGQAPLATPVPGNTGEFSFRNGVMFGMTPAQVKSAEQDAPVYEDWESIESSQVYHLTYANTKTAGQPCNIDYFFIKDELQGIVVNFSLGTGDVVEELKRVMEDVYPEINEALITKYGSADEGPHTIDRDNGDVAFITAWIAGGARGYEIQHAIELSGDSVSYTITYLYSPLDESVEIEEADEGYGV